MTAPYDKAGIAAQRILFEGNLYIRELFQHVCAVCYRVVRMMMIDSCPPEAVPDPVPLRINGSEA